MSFVVVVRRNVIKAFFGNFFLQNLNGMEMAFLDQLIFYKL